MNYLKQLDSLRAFAVLAVMIHHFSPLPAIKALSLGTKGVDLFFVLSGFLITTILLNSKVAVDNNQTTVVSAAKKFYFRRIMRIFPIYYLMLCVVVTFNIPSFRDSVYWHLAYLSNVYIAQLDKWPGAASHLWSLSVEEQFYLIWPWLIFWIPIKRLPSIFVGVVVLALISRVLTTVFLDFTPIQKAVSTLWNLDFFAVGALLAYGKYSGNERILRNLRKFAFWGTIVYFAIEVVTVLHPIDSMRILHNLFAAAFYMLLVNQGCKGFPGILGVLMEARPVVFVGKISYGIYLYHNFAPHFVDPLLSSVKQGTILLFIVNVMFSVIIATASWYIIESPLKNLKNRLENRKIEPTVYTVEGSTGV